MVLKEIPAQQPGPDEILINIKYSGVCHTDLHAVNGDWPLATKLPLVGRHEGAGIVVGIGSLVEDWDLGDHAGIKVCCYVFSFPGGSSTSERYIVDQWHLPAVLLLPTIRRAPLREGTSVRLHSRRHFPTILPRQSGTRGPHS